MDGRCESGPQQKVKQFSDMFSPHLNTNGTQQRSVEHDSTTASFHVVSALPVHPKSAPYLMETVVDHWSRRYRRVLFPRYVPPGARLFEQVLRLEV